MGEQLKANWPEKELVCFLDIPMQKP